MSEHKVVESFPDIPRSYTRRNGDWVQEGGNNSIIVLGTDRADFGPADTDIGLGTVEAEGGGAGTGCALISVGRKDEDGNPDFDADDSFLYLAMKTEVDKNMGTDDVVDDSGPAPAILAKSDNIRVVFRDTLKISLENEERNDYIYINNEMTKISQNDGVDVVMDKDTITIECSENSIVINRGDGTINITSKSEVNVYTKTAYVKADDSVTIESPTVDIIGPGDTTIDGTLHVKGAVTMDQTLDVAIKTTCPVIAVGQIVTGPGAGPSTMQGPLTVSGDVTGGGKSLDNHTHKLAASAKAGPDVVATLLPS